MFRTVPLSIIRSFSLCTQQWYMSYKFADSLRVGSGRNVLILLASCMTYTIAVCTVKTPDDGQRNCLKHVEFYSKNKFEKLVHLVGFVIRIYHDARSPERQIQKRKQELRKIIITFINECIYQIISLIKMYI